MKLTIKTVLGMYDKTKDGTPLVIKSGKAIGKPYQKANVTFIETGEKVVSMNVWSGNKCEVGQVMEGDIAEREWQGKKYYDFKAINKEAKHDMELGQIKFALAKHDTQIKDIQEFLKTTFPVELKKMADKKELDTKGYVYPEDIGEPNFDVANANAELETLSQEDDYETL